MSTRINDAASLSRCAAVAGGDGEYADATSTNGP